MSNYFSIIIPTYNRAHIIKSTLQSIIQQTFSDYEIIIVDDGSTDNTEEVVHSFKSDKIRYYKIQNSERGFARNFGASKAHCQWLYFMDSDDIIYTHHLRTAYEIIQKKPTLQIFHLAYEVIYPKYKQKKINIAPHQIIFGNPYGCQGMFIHKNLYMHFPFNEDRTIAGLEDWELWLRISAHYEIQHFPIVTSALIHHNERSVLQIDKDRWIKKVETFIQYVINNSDIVKKYKNKMHLFYCGAYSYLALHLSFDRQNKKEALYYLIKAWRFYPALLLKKRFYAILKRMVF